MLTTTETTQTTSTLFEVRLILAPGAKGWRENDKPQGNFPWKVASTDEPESEFPSRDSRDPACEFRITICIAPGRAPQLHLREHVVTAPLHTAASLRFLARDTTAVHPAVPLVVVPHVTALLAFAARQCCTFALTPRANSRGLGAATLVPRSQPYAPLHADFLRVGKSVYLITSALKVLESARGWGFPNVFAAVSILESGADTFGLLGLAEVRNAVRKLLIESVPVPPPGSQYLDWPACQSAYIALYTLSNGKCIFVPPRGEGLHLLPDPLSLPQGQRVQFRGYAATIPDSETAAAPCLLPYIATHPSFAGNGITPSELMGQLILALPPAYGACKSFAWFSRLERMSLKCVDTKWFVAPDDPTQEKSPDFLPRSVLREQVRAADGGVTRTIIYIVENSDAENILNMEGLSFTSACPQIEKIPEALYLSPP